MVSLVKNSTKKGAKIQNEYMFLLRCIMATSWIGNIYFSTLTAHVFERWQRQSGKSCFSETYDSAPDKDRVRLLAL